MTPNTDNNNNAMASGQTEPDSDTNQILEQIYSYLLQRSRQREIQTRIELANRVVVNSTQSNNLLH